MKRRLMDETALLTQIAAQKRPADDEWCTEKRPRDDNLRATNVSLVYQGSC